MSKIANPRPETQARLYRQIARAISYVRTERLRQPEVGDIADHVGMSVDHLQRTFADWAGVGPKKFLMAATLDAAKDRLRQSESVLDAAFEAGLSGPGRLHDLFVTWDAVTPGEFKSKGAGMTFRYGVHETPFGPCLVVLSARGLTGLSFIGDSEEVALAEQRKGWEMADWQRDQAATAQVARQAFDRGRSKGDLRLLLRGSPYRIKVWEALLRIPEGALTTYGDLAARIDKRSAARAVSNAIAGNLLGYVIPCHRVIRESGAITGYRWAPERKSVILAHEAVTNPLSGLETVASAP